MTNPNIRDITDMQQTKQQSEMARRTRRVLLFTLAAD